MALDGMVLREMLAQTSFVISQNESCYALNGVRSLAAPGKHDVSRSRLCLAEPPAEPPCTRS
jgi:hypothetical protein